MFIDIKMPRIIHWHSKLYVGECKGLTYGGEEQVAKELNL